jgi:hypothetical protein
LYDASLEKESFFLSAVERELKEKVSKKKVQLFNHLKISEFFDSLISPLKEKLKESAVEYEKNIKIFKNDFFSTNLNSIYHSVIVPAAKVRFYNDKSFRDSLISFEGFKECFKMNDFKLDEKFLKILI